MVGVGRPRGLRVDPFDRHWKRYESWFDVHENAYLAEIRALKALVPEGALGLEVGVGTGRFAGPLGIPFGVDPSRSMARVALERGIGVAMGMGEALPFRSAAFELVLMVTTVCFLEDLDRAFQEARRVLRPGGSVVVGLVDRESPLGGEYLQRQAENLFYRVARFYSVGEILSCLARAGFGAFSFRQTLFGPLEQTPPDEPVLEGHGAGSFVALRGTVLDHHSGG